MPDERPPSENLAPPEAEACCTPPSDPWPDLKAETPRQLKARAKVRRMIGEMEREPPKAPSQPLDQDDAKEFFLERYAQGETLRPILSSLGLRQIDLDIWVETDAEFSLALERAISRRVRRARMRFLDRMTSIANMVIQEALEGKRSISAARLALEMAGMRPRGGSKREPRPEAVPAEAEEGELRDILRDEPRRDPPA